MMRTRDFGHMVLVGLLFSSSIAFGAEATGANTAKAKTQAPDAQARDKRPNFPSLTAYHPAIDLPPKDSFVTHHVITVHGKKFPFTAIAGDTDITNLSGDVIGRFFSFSYIREGKHDPKRPVLFVFNGGPGSASVWLQMGVVGPWRVKLSSSVNPSVVPPFGLEDNPDCLLDVADIVFIDPVGTGFSRIVGKGKPEDFFGVDADANSVAQFMERWIDQHDRWNSPKFVMGESYGSFRAAILPRALMGGPTYMGMMRGVTLNGIVLLGTAFTEGNNIPADAKLWHAALQLPGEAAAAWYHGKVDKQGASLADWFEAADRYARTDYYTALQKQEAGNLTDPERDAVTQKLVHFTGLPASDIPADLKLTGRAFGEKLLASEQKIVGAYDSRYTLSSVHVGTDSIADDPAMGQYVPGFTGAFHEMLSEKLKVNVDRPYLTIDWAGANNGWKWDRTGAEPGQSAAVDLAVGMRRDTALKVFVGAGYYDLNSAAAAARHDLEMAQLPADRYQFKFYESGHMLYVGETAGPFADDVRHLILSASH